jgi:hypothetical protein
MSNLVPLSMLSAVTVLDSNLEGWTLLDVPAEETRAFQYDVTFEQPFAAAPLVNVAISGLDVGNQDAARLRLRAVDIHPGGFSIRAETWLNTRVWSVDVSWLAIGAAST